MKPELRGESFLIIGYGREGKSVHEFLKATKPGVRIGIADRQGVSGDVDPRVSVFSGESYLREAREYDTVIRSPGVSIREIAPYVGPSTHLTSATNIFFEQCPGKIIGITGTKGKSTTSALTASVLRQGFSDVRLVGNIGAPMLDYLKDANAQTCFVVELSSYQLEDLRRSPAIAILLNIVPEHLDYHGGFDAYCAAKLSIARNQCESDALIINDGFPLLSQMTEKLNARKYTFRERHDEQALVTVQDGAVVVRGQGAILKTAEIPVKGPGNLQNALAAITCGAVLGVALDKIRAGIISFQPLEHRLEFVGERSGIRFYNDSLSTIPEALAHALLALGDDVQTVIAGGYDRGVDMSPLGPALADSRVQTLILFPTTGEKIFEAAVNAAPDRDYRRVDVQSMEEAVQAAYDSTSPGKICVMSPASSSFSVFRDYRDRGQKFKDAVRLLAPSEPGASSAS